MDNKAWVPSGLKRSGMTLEFGVTGTSQILNTKKGRSSRIPMVTETGRAGGDPTGVWEWLAVNKIINNHSSGRGPECNTDVL